ncbi:hypothetical protein [Kribbella soli]|uniref:TPM domain-containing protein n=1 Tax=Kribbella soli TaxID=1124743 RepID=A0A4R0HMH8_9ACTN|nr:hypothetical protein [Kribbella soli]TCC11508.1 hypothetical protein E0H45_09615 [Kribbella soli]
MKGRFLLACLAAVLTLLVAAPAEAGTARTPAERAQEIATALKKDPVYIDPAYKTALPATLLDDLRTKAKALGYPVYTVVLPLTPSDEFQGEENTALTLVMDALRLPGLYVVVDGGSRFPWYETRDVSQVSEEKLQAARTRALADSGYDAGPTEVLARMYELLAQPGIPKTSTRPQSSRPSRSDSEPGGHGWIVALSIVGGLVVLVGLGLLIGRSRGSGGGREKTFRIPPHVAATVAAERRRRLTQETNAELTRLGSELAALPTTEGAGLVHQQAALDDHAAASKVLDSSTSNLVDLVGAMVLLDKARREYDAAVAIAADRKVDAVPELCAFNPLHGRSSGRPTKVESDGTTLTLPLCNECRQALKRRSAPASLPGKDGPYWYEDSLWARTFFGTTGDDLAAAVSRGELRR